MTVPSFGVKSILWKSAALAAVAGLYGIANVNESFFAVYAEVPPPLLGNPFVYQTLPNCDAGQYVVCPPLVQNNVLLAAIDFFVFFAVCFAVVFPILYKSRFHSTFKNGIVKRNSIAVTFLVIILILVSLTTLGSTIQGASLVEPHWPTPSGVEVYPLSYTLYSGSATNPSTQGTAHMDLTLANYHWTPVNASFSISLARGLTNHSTNTVGIYQCPTPSTCMPVSSVTVPPYSSLNLTSASTSLYFGTAVQKGEYYSIQVNMTGGGLVSFNTEAAL